MIAAPALAQQAAPVRGASAPEQPSAQVPADGTPETTAPKAPVPDPTAPPPWAGDHAADRYYDPTLMAQARAMAREEMGGMLFSKIMLNLAEYQTGSAGDGYRWDGQAWFGDDIDRLLLRSEGEGSLQEGLQTGEVQALYSHAMDRYLDLQAGVRQDFAPRGRTYLAIGAQSLVPFWFDVEGSLYLSTHGELLARTEATYDLRLLQRMVLQPRVELNFAARNTPETRTGAGLSNAEVGLRLRYEIRHELAPYIGVSWNKRFGRTATYWSAAGDVPEATTFVVGLRTWF
jgi:copper resistance protein B